jgi:hypothetical protein
MKYLEPRRAIESVSLGNGQFQRFTLPRKIESC